MSDINKLRAEYTAEFKRVQAIKAKERYRRKPLTEEQKKRKLERNRERYIERNGHEPSVQGQKFGTDESEHDALVQARIKAAASIVRRATRDYYARPHCRTSAVGHDWWDELDQAEERAKHEQTAQTK